MPAAKERVKLICAGCGTEFYRLESQLGRGRGRYCSKACSGKAKQHGTKLFCAFCDSPFYRRFGEQDHEKQFCSRRCYTEWRAMYRSPDTYLKTGRVHTHRVVAEAVLGRPLAENEVVHHIDSDKQNNHPSNLAVFPNQSYHARCHGGGMTDEELRRFSLLKASDS